MVWVSLSFALATSFSQLQLFRGPNTVFQAMFLEELGFPR